MHLHQVRKYVVETHSKQLRPLKETEKTESEKSCPHRDRAREDYLAVMDANESSSHWRATLVVAPRCLGRSWRNNTPTTYLPRVVSFNVQIRTRGIQLTQHPDVSMWQVISICLRSVHQIFIVEERSSNYHNQSCRASPRG